MTTETRELVWYGDIDTETISDDQYQQNLYHQVDEHSLPKDLPIPMLENVADYIPLVTDDIRLSFCRATKGLPENCQVQIWTHVLIHGGESFQPVTPRKTYEMSARMKSHMDRWSARRRLF